MRQRGQGHLPRVLHQDVEDLVVEAPVVEEPAVEEPVVKEPVVEEPVVEEPTVEEPVAQEDLTIEAPGVIPYCLQHQRRVCSKRIRKPPVQP